MSQITATLLGVAVAALALMLGLLTYVLSRGLLPLTPSGKLWDRIYELDKLVLAYPELFASFMAEVHRTSPYFYTDPRVVHTWKVSQIHRAQSSLDRRGRRSKCFLTKLDESDHSFVWTPSSPQETHCADLPASGQSVSLILRSFIS